MLFASLHICDLQEEEGGGRFECCLAILMLDSKESGSQGRSRREMESGKWEEGKERDSKLHGMSLVKFKGLFSQQKDDITFSSFFSC